MNKLKYLLIGLILLIPIKISAASASLSISCPDTAYPGDTVSCTISANTSGDINGVSGNYSLSDGLIYNSFTPSSSVSFNVNQTTQKGFVLGNTSGFPASFTLGTLKVTIPSSATADDTYNVVITNLGVSDVDYNDLSLSNISDSIKVVVKEVEKPVEPPKEEETSKPVETPKEEETKPIKPENNNQNTNKPSTQKKSNNANLSEVKLNGEKLTFLPYETEYVLNVQYNVDTMSITYELEDDKASAKVDGSSDLNVGENTFKITVTAEDGTKKVYTIKINRLEEDKVLSNNNYLSNLEIEDYEINFNKETLKYTVKIKNEKSLNIVTKTEDDKAKVYIEGNKELKNGSIINIIVMAEDNTAKEYTINIEKENNIILPIVLIGVALVGLITAIIVIVKKRNK